MGVPRKITIILRFPSPRQSLGSVVASKRSRNKEMYIVILRRLKHAVRRKHPEKLITNSWFLPHYSPPSYLSVFVKHFLAKKNVTNWSFPSTFLAWVQLIFTSCYDWTAVKLQKTLDGRTENVKMIPRNVCNAFTVAGTSVQLHKGTILKEM